jgi:hypothetical protein
MPLSSIIIISFIRSIITMFWSLSNEECIMIRHALKVRHVMHVRISHVRLLIHVSKGTTCEGKASYIRYIGQGI